MTFTAKVHNCMITLPPGIKLPEGAEVQVIADEAGDELLSSPLAWMKRYVGAAKDLPPDFSAEHDHYIHGTPKRQRT